MTADETDATGGIEIITREAVVEHGEPIVIAFHEQYHQWDDPAYHGNERDEKHGHEKDGLPGPIAQSDLDSPGRLLPDLRPTRGMVIILDNGFGLPAYIGEDGRTDDENNVFEEGEVEEEQGEPEDDAGECEEESEETILKFLTPIAESKDMRDVFDDVGGRPAEEIHACDEQAGINQARDQYPFP